MSSWITHDRIPKADTAVRIAKTLGVSVEYLVTGEEDEILLEQEYARKEVSHAVDNHAVYLTPNNHEFSLSKDDEVILLPVLDQKASAGYGAMVLDQQQSGYRIPVLRRLVAQYNPDKLKAVEVRGDSMTGVRMFDGDIVVFATGYLSSEGIYVLSINGDVLVKRVEFDSLDRTIKISSENPRYPDIKTISTDNDNVTINGKVVAWFHCHPY
jgi:phage repressor protein C with HTH and peptisase S24 domain